MNSSVGTGCCYRQPLAWQRGKLHAPPSQTSLRHNTRIAAAPARASTDKSNSNTGSWPRHGKPDWERSCGPEQSREEDAVSASLDEAQLAKNRETFLLRLASLGFGAVLVGERITGRGVVQALGHPTGIPLYEMDLALGILVGALFIGGLVPTRFIYSSVTDKPESVFEDIPALLGRLSCIGLGTTIAAEATTGKGVLGLLNFETGTETLTEIEFAAVFLLLLFVTNWRSKKVDEKA